ncbi:MAG: hypothetical protein GC134_00810 [Proteobacteria bacterium]|nr:hypothetical protein [Pseudomonadota bacterium]
MELKYLLATVFSATTLWAACATSGYAQTTSGIETKVQEKNVKILDMGRKIDEELILQKGETTKLSQTIDELYTLLAAKYAAGNNGSRVPVREKQLPDDFGLARVSDFKLVDHNGKVLTRQSLEGRKSLIYFGFTNCPDMCPNTLDHLASLYQSLPRSERARTDIYFFTVDPKDNSKKLGNFVTAFDDTFKGVKSPQNAPDEMTKVMQNFAVVADKVDFGNQADQDSWLFRHTTTTFYINPEAQFYGRFDLAQEDSSVAELRSVLMADALPEADEPETVATAPVTEKKVQNPYFYTPTNLGGDR